MSNTIRKIILGVTATAALVFAPVSAVAMADDAVDSPAADEVTEKVEFIDSSDAAATDDSVEAEVIEEAPATEDTDTETEVVEEQSAPQEDPEPVKAEGASSQPAQEGSDSQESTPKKESAPAETSKGDKASQESAPEKAQPKSDAESKSQKKTVVQDDSSTSTTSSDDTPDVDEPEVISDQEDDSEPPVEDDGSGQGDDGTEEDSFTNVAYNHRTDHQNQVLILDILYEYSEANDTTGWKVDLIFYDENGNPTMVAEGVQVAPAGESMTFSLAENGPGIYNVLMYYKTHDNLLGGTSIKLLVPATPVGPTQDKEGQKLIIPEDDNFDYSYTNAGMTVPIGSGTHWIGPVGEVVVTAKIKPGNVADQNATTEWTFNFVESGNPGGDDGDDGDDNTPEVTVITPDKSWVEHIKNPGQNDDQAEVRSDYQDKVLVATVEHHDGRVDVVLVPGDGYAFPDNSANHVISFTEFVESDDNDGDGDDSTGNGGDDSDSGSNDGNSDGDDNTGDGDDDSKGSDSDDSDSDSIDSDDSDSDGDSTDDDTEAGSDGKDDDSDDSDSDSKTNGRDDIDKSKGSDSDSDSDSKGDGVTKDGSRDGNINSNSSGKEGATGGDTKSGLSNDKSKSGDLNENFEAHTGVEDFPVWAPIAGAAMVLAAAAGMTVRYHLQK